MLDRSKHPAISSLQGVRLDFPQPRNMTCGIPLWTLTGAEEPVSRLAVFIKGGALNEHRPMVAIMTAMMMIEGSQDFDTDKIGELMDYHGVWKAAQSHDTMMELSLSMPNECFPLMMPLLLDALRHPTFPEAEFEVIKQRYASSCAIMHTQVKQLAAMAMRRLYYGVGHPLVADVTPEQIMRLTTDDLRRHHERYCHPANCVAILSGDVTAQLTEAADRTFAQWVDQASPSPDQPMVINSSSRHFELVDKPDAVQAAITMTIRAIGRNHPDYIKLRILCVTLGGYFGSRLNRNIREQKGYTYGISAYLSGRADDGYIGIDTECSTEYVADVIEQVKHELRALREHPIPMDEFKLVRQYMISDLVKTLDTPFALAGYVASTFLYGVSPEYFNQQVHTLYSVTPVQLLTVAQRYFDLDSLRIVVAGKTAQLNADWVKKNKEG